MSQIFVLWECIVLQKSFFLSHPTEDTSGIIIFSRSLQILLQKGANYILTILLLRCITRKKYQKRKNKAFWNTHTHTHDTHFLIEYVWTFCSCVCIHIYIYTWSFMVSSSSKFLRLSSLPFQTTLDFHSLSLSLRMCCRNRRNSVNVCWCMKITKGRISVSSSRYLCAVTVELL